jgi:hypothetical protein
VWRQSIRRIADHFAPSQNHKANPAVAERALCGDRGIRVRLRFA